MRILAIDDNALNLKLLTVSLESQGHTIKVIMDPCEAVAAAEAFSPQLILLDIAMPRRDGIQVLADLRRLPQLRDVPIHALTAQEKLDGLPGPEAGGFTSIIRKPCSLRQLLELIAAAGG